MCYNYAPLINPRALRWTAIAEELAARGHQVHLVCSKVQGEPMYEVRHGVHIYRHGLRSQPLPKPKSKNQEQPLQSSFVKLLVRFIYRKFLSGLAWPDSNFLWILAAIKKSKKILFEKKITHLISVSHPFSGHVVGYKLFKFKKDINWVADIGDPFSFLEFVTINNQLLYKQWNHHFEKKVIHLSQSQTVTTDLTKKEYLRKGFDCQNSMTVIPPLLRSFEAARATNTKKIFRWVFVGTLYKKIRNPTYLLNLFEVISNTNIGLKHELHFYGETKMCADDLAPFQSLFGKSIFLHGLVPSDVAQEACVQASLLVNIGNKTSYQLPSKLVEYTYLGLPILNITSIAKDSSESFLEDYPFAININESTSVHKGAQLIIDQMKDFDLDSFDNTAFSKPFTLSSVVSCYEKLLKD